MTRAVLLLPGRGSYTERSLASLPEGHPLVERAEELRAESNLEPLAALDGAERFSARAHLRPANASPLIYLLSYLDAQRAAERYELVAVGGNSLGWYSALAVAGALSFEDGFHLVQTMGLLQERHQSELGGGGQLIYPCVDADWRPDAQARAQVEAALASAPGHAFPSIHLGGYEVLAGSQEGMTALTRSLPPVELGKNRYPLKLVGHGPYHTPLVASVAEEARRRLAELAFRRPRVPLLDGCGRAHTPWSADPAALARYTLGEQVTTPYDFTASVRVGLREYAPERLVLPGPGNSLGAICAQVLLAEGWSGISNRSDFVDRQDSSSPLVDSMGR